MSYLLDSNVISELRRIDKCHPKVLSWFRGNMDDAHFVSVITLGEIRNGVELKRLKDERTASVIEAWLDQVWAEYRDSILPITPEIADCWGRLNCPTTLPTADSLIAATALVHGLTVVTRNEKDFIRMGVKLLNPFV